MTERQKRGDPMGRLAELAVRNRYDPERLAAIKRVMTGTTRCPQCDELNRADQKTCRKCGAALYPEHKKKAPDKDKI